MSRTGWIFAAILIVVLILLLLFWFAQCKKSTTDNVQQTYSPHVAPNDTIPIPSDGSILKFLNVSRDVTFGDHDGLHDVETPDERFSRAKRKLPQHSLVTGVYSDAQRRKLLDRISRRPFCSQRTRSWRTQFSDHLRGDVRPLHQNNWNIMRPMRSNYTLDLHAGALGTVSGYGKWDAKGGVASNYFDDDILIPPAA